MLVLKKIRPIFNHILVTADVYKPVEGSIITDQEASGSIKEVQKVVAVGSLVKEVKVGDTIVINPARYEVRKFRDGSMNDGVIQQNRVVSYNFPMVEIDGEDYMYITEGDVSYIVEEFEEVQGRVLVEPKDLTPGGIIL